MSDATSRLFLLLDEMRSRDIPFNAIVLGPMRTNATGTVYRDVAVLALVDNAVGWEVVAESANGLYDLWFNGQMMDANLSKKTAADKLLDRYTHAKIARVGRRMTSQN